MLCVNINLKIKRVIGIFKQDHILYCVHYTGKWSTTEWLRISKNQLLLISSVQKLKRYRNIYKEKMKFTHTPKLVLKGIISVYSFLRIQVFCKVNTVHVSWMILYQYLERNFVLSIQNLHIPPHKYTLYIVANHLLRKDFVTTHIMLQMNIFMC